MNLHMNLAIQEAQQGIQHAHGGPFGAVVVREGKVIGSGHNMVLKNNDPTAHGEISAIRDAGANEQNFDLSGAELYTTGEPCPMCLSAILWANIDKVYYGCSLLDNEKIGFRDDVFNNLLSIDRTALYETDRLSQIDRDECMQLFDEYLQLNPQNY